MTSLVVACWLCIRDGTVLAVRPHGLSEWYLPGGLVEPGEPLPDAVVREVNEEVGVRLDISTVAERARVTGLAHGRPDTFATLVLFDADGAGEPVAQPPEIADVAWLGPARWNAFAPLAEQAVGTALS